MTLPTQVFRLDLMQVSQTYMKPALPFRFHVAFLAQLKPEVHMEAATQQEGDVPPNSLGKHLQVRSHGDRQTGKTASMQVKQAPVLANLWWLWELSREDSRDAASMQGHTSSSSAHALFHNPFALALHRKPSAYSYNTPPNTAERSLRTRIGPASVNACFSPVARPRP